MTVSRAGAIDSAGIIPATIKRTGAADANGISFSQYLSKALKETNTLILESEKLSDDFASGRTENIHEVLIAAEKADIALQFTMQIRNKILDAYNEIMRMQI